MNNNNNVTLFLTMNNNNNITLLTMNNNNNNVTLLNSEEGGESEQEPGEAQSSLGGVAGTEEENGLRY